MPLIKVTIFQKNLTEGLNINVMKKLVSTKSDIMILPEYFNADSNIKSIQELQDREKSALDWLLKLNHSYKRIIIGGSIIHKEENNNKLYNACPIIFNGEVIDWYYKRNLTSSEEKKFLTPGSEAGIYILNNIRFAVLIGEDYLEKSYIEELKDQNIKLIFIVSKTFIDDKTNTEEILLNYAKKNQQVFVKCDAVGTLIDKKLKGKSLYVSPNGISWHIPPQEEEKQIIKDIMVQI